MDKIHCLGFKIHEEIPRADVYLQKYNFKIYVKAGFDLSPCHKALCAIKGVTEIFGETCQSHRTIICTKWALRSSETIIKEICGILERERYRLSIEKLHMTPIKRWE